MKLLTFIRSFLLVAGSVLLSSLVNIQEASAVITVVAEFETEGVAEPQEVIRQYYANDLAAAEAAHPSFRPIIAVAGGSVHERLPQSEGDRPDYQSVRVIYAILGNNPEFCDSGGCLMVALADRIGSGWQEFYRTKSTGYLLIGHTGWVTTERDNECHAWTKVIGPEFQAESESGPCDNHAQYLIDWMPDVLWDGGIKFKPRHVPDGSGGYKRLVFCPVQRNDVEPTRLLLAEYLSGTNFQIELHDSCVAVLPPATGIYYKDVYPGRAFTLEQE